MNRDPRIIGRCDGGDCNGLAVSLAYDSRLGVLIPVCWRHLCAYPVRVDGRRVWQAEDEFAGLQFCRRSRFRWLAQLRLLADQCAAMAGRESRAQRRLRARREM